MTHTMLHLLEEEGMMQNYAREQFEVLARCHAALGEQEEAVRYARLHLDDLYQAPEFSEQMEPGAVEAFLRGFDADN